MPQAAVHTGHKPLRTSAEIVERAKVDEVLFHSSSLTPTTGTTIRGLADLSPATLAVMHGSSFNGNAVSALHQLGDLYDEWFKAAALMHCMLAHGITIDSVGSRTHNSAP